MNDVNNDFEGLRQVLGESIASFEVPHDELREIDELRRLASEMLEPEPLTFTTSGAAPVPEFTVHYINVLE